MKKSFTQKISNALNTVDILNDHVHLNIEGKIALTSSLGGIVSILILVFLGFQVVTQSMEMFQKISPQVIQINDPQQNPTAVEFNTEQDFFIAMTTMLGDNYINMSNNSLISFKTMHFQQVTSNSGVKVYPSEIHWAPCNSSNLPKNANLLQGFELFPLDHAFCPTFVNFTDPDTGICPQSVLVDHPDCLTPFNLRVQGYVTNLDFRYLQFQFTICNQSHSSSTWGLKCSSDNITENFYSSNLVSASLFFTNNAAYTVKYDNPQMTYLERYDWFVHPMFPKNVEISVERQVIQDYDDYFFTGTYHNRTLYSVSYDKIREQIIYSRDLLLNIYIYRGSLDIISIRKYSKVVDLISNIGGLLQFIVFIGAIAVRGYSHYKYHMILTNELYDFEPTTKKQNSPRKIEPLKSLKTDETPRDNTFSSPRRIKIKPKKLQKPKEKNKSQKTVKDFFDFQKKKKRIIGYGLFDYLKEVFFTVCCKRNSEEQLAHKARKYAMNDLNIIKIIDKLKEIDKLKMLLMNRHQLEAFNFIERPVVTLNSNKLTHKEPKLEFLKTLNDKDKLPVIKDPEEYETKSQYRNLYLAYRRIRDDNDPNNAAFNEKLLSMLNEDLLNLFQQVDRFMDGNFDPTKFDEVLQKMQDESAEISFQDLEDINSNL